MLDLRPTSAGYILSGLSARFKGRVRSKEPPEQFPFEAVSPWLLFRAVHVQQLGLSSLVELTEDLVERVHVGFQVLVGSPLLVGDQWAFCPHHLTGSCSGDGGMRITCPAEILLLANMPMPLPMPASFITTGGQDGLCRGQTQFLIYFDIASQTLDLGSNLMSLCD